MQHVDDPGKTDGIDCSICVAVEIVDDFQNAAPAKPFQRLGGGMFLTVLRIMDRSAHYAANVVGKARRSPLADPTHSVVF